MVIPDLARPLKLLADPRNPDEGHRLLHDFVDDPGQMWRAWGHPVEECPHRLRHDLAVHIQ